MKNNSISCIVPCYNSQNFISKTVYSLINQTIKPLEIILVNDASTDNTLYVLKQMEVKHPNVIKVIDLETNKGPSYARNLFSPLLGLEKECATCYNYNRNRGL